MAYRKPSDASLRAFWLKGALLVKIQGCVPASYPNPTRCLRISLTFELTLCGHESVAGDHTHVLTL